MALGQNVPLHTINFAHYNFFEILDGIEFRETSLMRKILFDVMIFENKNFLEIFFFFDAWFLPPGDRIT